MAETGSHVGIELDGRRGGRSERALGHFVNSFKFMPARALTLM